MSKLILLDCADKCEAFVVDVEDVKWIKVCNTINDKENPLHGLDNLRIEFKSGGCFGFYGKIKDVFEDINEARQ